MDPEDALAQLMELSTELVEVAVAAADGTLEAHTGCSPERAEELVRAGAELVALVGEGPDVTRIGVERADGGFHVVVESGRSAVATTVADATSGLVAHDLRTVLRRSAPRTVEA